MQIIMTSKLINVIIFYNLLILVQKELEELDANLVQKEAILFFNHAKTF